MCVRYIWENQEQSQLRDKSSIETIDRGTTFNISPLLNPSTLSIGRQHIIIFIIIFIFNFFSSSRRNNNKRTNWGKLLSWVWVWVEFLFNLMVSVLLWSLFLRSVHLGSIYHFVFSSCHRYQFQIDKLYLIDHLLCLVGDNIVK